jgi:phage gpG-like protein
MKFELSTSDLQPQLQELMQGWLTDPNFKRQMLGAMAARFKMICVQNLGEGGIDRPVQWKSLSDRYAKRVNRSFATLDTDIGKSPYNGRRPTGTLSRSIRINVGNDSAVIYVDPEEVPYAYDHQFGEGHMPARPFFPMTEIGLTPYAEQELIAVAEEILESALSDTPSIAIY